MKKLIAIAMMSTVSLTANAYQASDLYGTWCFYEQEYEGNTFPEKVTIVLNKDGTYKWLGVFWKQDGTWSVSENKLIMTDVGTHKLKSVTSEKVEMLRLTIMKMKKGACK
jgi:hypothetical protein